MGTWRRLRRGTEYLTVLLIVLECRSVYAQAVELDLHIPTLAAAALLVLLVLKTAGRRVSKPLLKRWAVLFLPLSVVLLALAAASVPRERLPDFALRFLVVLPVLTLLFLLDREDGQGPVLLARLSDVMTLLAALSLVFWVLASQLRLIPATGEWNAKWLTQNFYVNYFGIYFECQTVIFLGYSGFRNTGIFCEPSMYSLCLAAALAYELFLRERHVPSGSRVRVEGGKLQIRRRQEFRRLKILLLSAAIVTTFATSGIVLLALLMFFKYASLKPKSLLLQAAKLLSLGAILATVGLFAYAVFQIRIPAAAWNAVVNSYTEGLRLWESAPLFGTGYAGSDQAASLLKSNSFFAILAEGGLVLFAVYLVPLAGAAALSLKRRQFGMAAPAFIAAFELLTVLVPYTYLILLLLACCASCLPADRRVRLGVDADGTEGTGAAAGRGAADAQRTEAAGPAFRRGADTGGAPGAH